MGCGLTDYIIRNPITTNRLSNKETKLKLLFINTPDSAPVLLLYFFQSHCWAPAKGFDNH